MAYTGDAKRAYQLQWIKRRRDAWIAENGPCATCGSSRELQVDHIDPSTKLVQPAGIWSRKAEFRTAELAKCQVLCRVCHELKSAEELRTLPPHGTKARYSRKDALKCRCDACRAAAWEYERLRRMKLSCVAGPGVEPGTLSL